LKFGLIGKLLFAQGLGAALSFTERQGGEDQPIANETFLIGFEALIRVGGCHEQNQDSNRQQNGASHDFLQKWIGPASHEIETGGPRMANESTRLTNRFYPKKLEMEINPGRKNPIVLGNDGRCDRRCLATGM
jgi:hypothetical protein